jgi:rhodanese-related sulfurtransferase
MASKVAARFGVRVIKKKQLALFKAEKDRTLYIIDVRTPAEYRTGHRSDSSYGWGVQLVQGMDKHAAARNARVVLVDDRMVRALMTASWLVQADWPETYVLADPFAGVDLVTGDYKSDVPGLDELDLPCVEPADLHRLLQAGQTVVLDVADSLSYRRGHIPGAWFVIRSRMADSLDAISVSQSFVVTGDDLVLAALTARDLARVSDWPVSILRGGNAAWREAKLPLNSGFERLATPADDIFRQPFLWGQFEPMSDDFKTAAYAYFEWELQLVEQLDRAAELSFGSAGAIPCK